MPNSKDAKPHWAIYPRVPLAYPHASLRLLQIDPGWPGDPIHVSLIAVDERESAPSYTALSYTWGDPKVTETINCNGVDIDVTTSLANALRVLRQLPADGDPSANGISVISKDHPLHSSNRVWAELGRNINEDGVIEQRRAGASQSGGDNCFWIDALCINQEDMSERAAQVGTMRDIYTRAEKVMIFLGTQIRPEAEMFTPAQLAELVSKKIDKSLPRMKMSDLGPEPLVMLFLVQALRNESRVQTDGSGFKQLAEKGFPDFSAKEWNALRAFFELPWFYRVWIVQEIVLAKNAKLTIGTWEIDWEPFARACEVLAISNLPIAHNVRLNSTSKQQWTGFKVGPASYLASIGQTPEKTLPLYALLCNALDRGATDPVDHVYAVLAMASELVDPNQEPAQKELLEVDYEKPIGTVFRDATRFVLHNHRSLLFLTKAQLTPRSRSLAGYRSWSPNWAEPRTSSPLLSLLFDASLKQTGYSADCNTDPDLLLVPGYKVGRVVFTTDVLPGSWNGWHYPPKQPEIEFLNAAWRLADECLGVKKANNKPGEMFQPGYYSSLDDAVEAFVYTVTANHDDGSGNGRGDGGPLMLKSGKTWLKKHARAFPQGSSSLMKKMGSMVKGAIGPPDDVLFQSAFLRASVGRKFFVTDHGFMGIGSAETEEADEVAVIGGVSVPIMLRREDHKWMGPKEAGGSGEEKDNERYLVVGECYVHGAMDGEVVKHQDSLGREPEIFRLI